LIVAVDWALIDQEGLRLCSVFVTVFLSPPCYRPLKPPLRLLRFLCLPANALGQDKRQLLRGGPIERCRYQMQLTKCVNREIFWFVIPL